MISEKMKVAMQGIIPSAVVTVDQEGVPNISYVSQIYYVDDLHVALSHQFLNKTIRNIKGNAKASVNIVSPEDFTQWRLDLEHSHSETEGNLFDQMSMQLEAIASTQGMSDVFKLQSADVYKVLAIERCHR